MDKYISREAVFDEIRFQRELAESDGEASVVDTCDAMLHNLKEIKAADVQPVKYGRWIPQGDNMWLCSNCKKNIIYSEHESDRTEKQRYCCRCGARMDGDSDA